ncbi:MULTISPECIES: hypothetical protein [unclassified Methylophaga]|uniref:HNH endonuclease n=2 Tax=Methylophaga TaxID=40222 RepID=UPI00259CBA9F|nr:MULTISPECIES: hypothetical protein [unclassified Methylophaga]
MKLDVDLSHLWKVVSAMGAEIVNEFHLNPQTDDIEFDIDKELSSNEGKSITLDELDTSQGILSVEGRQVLLFIPDQSFRISEVIEDPSKGRKFHVADCKTLKSMRQKNRFDRYSVTNNLSGLFRVFGTEQITGKDVDDEVELEVCKNCLAFLNYENYRNSSSKWKIFSNFTIDDFFSTYSTVFPHLPKKFSNNNKTGYTKDWKDVSEAYRKQKSFICECCSLDLNSHKKLLHTHHMDGNKHNNKEQNLQALCIDCHRKQPLHEQMFIKQSDMQTITLLRKEQGLLDELTWSTVLDMSDSSLHGLLMFYQKKGKQLPEVGYRVELGSEVVLLELAWPSAMEGVVMTYRDKDKLRQRNWNIKTLGEAFEEMNL